MTLSPISVQIAIRPTTAVGKAVFVAATATVETLQHPIPFFRQPDEPRRVLRVVIPRQSIRSFKIVMGALVLHDPQADHHFLATDMFSLHYDSATVNGLPISLKSVDSGSTYESDALTGTGYLSQNLNYLDIPTSIDTL